VGLPFGLEGLAVVSFRIVVCLRFSFLFFVSALPSCSVSLISSLLSVFF